MTSIGILRPNVRAFSTFWGDTIRRFKIKNHQIKILSLCLGGKGSAAAAASAAAGGAASTSTSTSHNGNNKNDNQYTYCDGKVL